MCREIGEIFPKFYRMLPILSIPPSHPILPTSGNPNRI